MKGHGEEVHWRKTKILRTDNGDEYTSTESSNYLKEEGGRHSAQVDCLEDCTAKRGCGKRQSHPCEDNSMHGGRIEASSQVLGRGSINSWLQMDLKIYGKVGSQKLCTSAWCALQ